jgi:hypothetical protein
VLLLLLVAVSGISIVTHIRNASMQPDSFFAEAPKAERAFLGAYGSDELKGRYGIRIEMEALSFTDPGLDRELEPEIILDHLGLPSIVPAELANTRFSPDPNEPPPLRYEGSFYFLGEHNWVDLEEIRFLDATERSVLAEYHLVVHLPKRPPDEYHIVLTVPTEIETGDSVLEPPRTVDGIGTLVHTEKGFWQCDGSYDGKRVQIELSADPGSFEEIAAYARSVITQEAITRSKLNEEISDGLALLADKFERFKVSPDFAAEDFVPCSFYFYKRRHHEEPEAIIVLEHPADVGHWSLDLHGTRAGILNWVPK